MWEKIKIWVKRRFHKTVNSIAFYPAFIALLFIVLASLVLAFDFSETGMNIKAEWQWLRLKDASTARSIISAVAAGIISLTVFSFSMVMIVLNQAASQLSNRMLDNLIGNRFQQIVLGVYIGTIVYALFLLSTIRDTDQGISIAALSTYLLILLTIIDIFIFIYFLHYITQSVKYEVIISRIYADTMKEMEAACYVEQEEKPDEEDAFAHSLMAVNAGVYEGLDRVAVLGFCAEHGCKIQTVLVPGSFVLAGRPVLRVDQPLNKEEVQQLSAHLFINESESIHENYYYGFRQLTEVALKALSPGVNDPGTAILAIRALFRLSDYRGRYFPVTRHPDEDGVPRIFLSTMRFEDIFRQSILPIWDYGKNDRLVQHEMRVLLKQLLTVRENSFVQELLNAVETKIKESAFS